MRGRRRSSWGLQKRWQACWIWRGSVMMRFAWQAQGFWSLRCRCLKPPMQNPWKGCKFHVTEVLLCSDHFAWQLQDFVCLGSNHPISWSSDQSRTGSFNFQINWQPIPANLERNWLPKSIESQSKNSQNHLSHTSVDQPAAWISDQLTTKSFEFQINWQTNRLNLTTIDNQLTWIWRSDGQANQWIQNQLTTKPLELQLVSFWHQLIVAPTPRAPFL